MSQANKMTAGELLAQIERDFFIGAGLAEVVVMGTGTWVCVYKNTNHVIRISTVNLNQDWQIIEHRLKEIIKEQ